MKLEIILVTFYAVEPSKIKGKIVVRKTDRELQINCYLKSNKYIFSERTPAYRGGSFLLQREQHYILRRVAATYTLSTGVDSRASHGIL